MTAHKTRPPTSPAPITCRSCSIEFASIGTWQTLCPECWQTRRKATDGTRNAPMAPKGITLAGWIEEGPIVVADTVDGAWLDPDGALPGDVVTWDFRKGPSR